MIINVIILWAVAGELVSYKVQGGLVGSTGNLFSHSIVYTTIYIIYIPITLAKC